MRADVTREAEVREMVEHVARELGGLDGLVNNAGWTQRVPHRQLDDLTDEIWERVLATNLRGPFYCVRAAVPHMERRGGGAIVNITSVASATGTGSSMAYAASKAGLDTLTKSLARALAPARIRVNAVAPGLLGTGFGGGIITPDVLELTGRATPDRAAGPAGGGGGRGGVPARQPGHDRLHHHRGRRAHRAGPGGAAVAPGGAPPA